MVGNPEIYKVLKELNISFDYYEHPPAPTVEIASKYWKDIEATHCKNLFFRNHKGNRHYLVVLDCNQTMQIHELELILKQGKLTFASPQRMFKYLGVQPGSVTPLGLVNDINKHVYLYLDKHLQQAKRISFHPGINTASLVLKFEDFERFLEWTGNAYEFIGLY